MYPFDYLAWSTKQKHEELLREADESRMLDQAFRSKQPAARGLSKFLTLVGKELGNVGFSLEMHFGGQPEPMQTLNQQNNQSGCP